MGAATGRRSSLLAGLRQMSDRLVKSPHQLEREELRAESGQQGATLIRDLVDRQMAQVCGAVTSVSLVPQADVPALAVELDDGSRTLRLVWLGRRAIAGIHPGTHLVARGRVCRVRSAPTIFNPAYEILPDGPG